MFICSKAWFLNELQVQHCLCCVHMFCQFLQIMSCNLILQWTLFLCCMFVCFIDCCKSYNLILKQASSSTLFMCSFALSIVAKVVTSSSSKSYIKQIKHKLHVATISLGFQAFLKFFSLPVNLKPCVLSFNL